MVNCQLRNYCKGRGRKMGVVEGGGGGGGLTWPLVLRIFGMVSITFFFAPPSGNPHIYSPVPQSISILHNILEKEGNIESIKTYGKPCPLLCGS